MNSDQKHKKKSALYYLLLFLVLELLFGILILSVEQHTRHIFYENRAKHIKGIHDVAISRFEAVAHLGAHTTLQQTDLIDLMKQAAATTDQAKHEQIRTALKADLQIVYDLLLKEAPMMMHLVLSDGTSLLRMHRPDQWGDLLIPQRRILSRSLEHGVEQSGYEAGPYSFGAYRFLFPLKSSGNMLGALEFSLEHQSLISFLNSKQQENNWFMLINNHELLQKPQEKHGELAEIPLADYRIIMPAGQTDIPDDITKYILRIKDNNSLAAKLHSGQIFSLPLGSRAGVPVAATFLPIKDSSGQLSVYSMVLGTTPVLKQLERVNSVVFPLGSGLLLATILLLYKQSVSRQQLLEERETLSAITQGMGEGLVVQSMDGKLLYLNKEAERLLGYTVEDFEGDTVHEKLQRHVKNRSEVCKPLQAVTSGNSYTNEHVEFTTANGSLLPVAIKATPLVKSGEISGAVMLFSDIRQQLAAERQVKVTNQLYAALSEVNHAIVEASSSEWLYREICRIAVDTACFKAAYIYQFSENNSLNLIAANDSGLLLHEADMVDLQSETFCSFTAMQIQKPSCVNCDFCLVDQLKGKQQVVFEHNSLRTAAYPLICDGQVVAVITFSDDDPASFSDQHKELLNKIVTDVSFALDNLLRQKEHQNAVDALHIISNFDALTGLPNRSLFIDRLEQAIRNAQKGTSTIALALMGINRFKEINNSLGHGIGDIVLREVARRLKDLVPEQYTLARPGGDEFLLLMPDLGATETAHLVSSLLTAVSMQPITIPGQSLAVSVRAGITIWPDDAAEAERLLKNVYAALDRTDFAEDSDYQFFSADMAARLLERVVLENDLRTALSLQQFTVFYQPKVKGQSNEVVGCEALVRWNHPERGMIGPDRFIPFMEELGLIGQLGEWVLHEACQQVIKWDRTGLPGLHIAVNLSPIQIENPDLVSVVQQAVEQVGLPAERLELEITESAAMHDVEQTIAMLRRLREIGCRIAIDDFGTGHSSLAQLKRIAADTLKIDRSFIMELPDNKEDLAIAEAILSLAATLGMEVVAEGVETAEQVEFLNQKNCTLLQGYFYSKPLPADQFEQFVKSKNKVGHI